MTPEQWIRGELVQLWTDLEEAQRRAANGDWSIECEGIAERIKSASELVGPVDYEDVSMASLIVGWFTAMNTRIGMVDPKLPTEADVARYRDLLPENDPLRLT